MNNEKVKVIKKFMFTVLFDKKQTKRNNNIVK